MGRKISLKKYNSDEVKTAFQTINATSIHPRDDGKEDFPNKKRGAISADLLVKFLTKYGKEETSEKRARKLVNLMGSANNQDYVDFDEFVSMMMN